MVKNGNLDILFQYYAWDLSATVLLGLIKQMLMKETCSKVLQRVVLWMMFLCIRVLEGLHMCKITAERLQLIHISWKMC